MKKSKKSKKLFIPVLVSIGIFLVGVYFLGKANNGSFIKSVFAERDNRDNDRNNNDRDNNNNRDDDSDKDNDNNRDSDNDRDDDGRDNDRKKITIPNSEKNKEESRKEKEEPKKEEAKKEEPKKEEPKKEEPKKEETKKEETKKEEPKKEEVKKEEAKKEEAKKEEAKKEESKKEETKKEETKKEESKKEESKKTSTKKEEVKEKKVTIETQDDTAEKVEFYIKKEEGDQDVYLGNAEKNSESDSWELDVDVDERIPNGDYVINAEIEDKEGKWKSEEVGVQVDLGLSGEAAGAVSEEVKNKNKEKVRELNEEQKQAEFASDWDMDGMSDEEEARLGTDPYSADSDQDGFVDGDEIKGGFDPLKFSPGDKSDKVVFEEPKEKGEVSDKYAVKEVKHKEDAKADKKKISFAGKALPNSFVTLYIYSEKPIIVTVKTDSEGNWTYDLDKDLEDGDHEVYVAVTDNTGKVTAKSNPLKFVKTAQAIESESTVSIKAPLEQERMYMLAYGVAIIVTVISLALVIISIVVKKKPNGNKELN